LHAELGETEGLPFRARRIAGLLALCLQGSLLLRHSPSAVADAFCASRLGGDWGAVLGTLPVRADADKIVERASVPPV
jgi:putative acyl-CoA dehydrogenase